MITRLKLKEVLKRQILDEADTNDTFTLDGYKTFKHLSDLYSELDGGCLGITINRS